MMSFSKDGNFQQSQHLKKYDKEDVPLTKGKSYYADEDEYEDYLRSRIGTEADTEVISYYILGSRTKIYTQTSTCSNFKALTNQYWGKDVSGVVSLTFLGMVLCYLLEQWISSKAKSKSYP